MSFTKETWGNNIWYLFHTIAHKIKESEFSNSKNDIITIVKMICSNLPCPECSADATNLLNKVDFKNITCKQDFKLLIFNFHNHVNRKLKKPEFKIEQLDEKYSKANIEALYKNFNIIFTSNSNIPQLMSVSFHRQRNVPVINNILNNLLSKYE